MSATGKATLRWAVARADDAPLKDALVWLTPSTALLEHGDDGYRTILPDPVKARVRDGVMSVEVFATDDPAFQPVGWAWQVHLVAPNGPDPFYVYAPGGVVTDVAGVAPVLTPDGDWVVKGEPGKPGPPGEPGEPGEPGKDGRGVAGTEVDGTELVLTMSDDTQERVPLPLPQLVEVEPGVFEIVNVVVQEVEPGVFEFGG